MNYHLSKDQGRACACFLALVNLIILLQKPRLNPPPCGEISSCRGMVTAATGDRSTESVTEAVIGSGPAVCGEVLLTVYGGEYPLDIELYSPFYDPLDLTAATHDEITLLPGVGDVLARAIVEKRAVDEPLESKKWLLTVPGIGIQRYERLAGLLTVPGERHD